MSEEPEKEAASLAPDFEFGKKEVIVQQSPLTMALLFYIVTVGGIISACLRTLVGNATITDQSLTTVLVGGAIAGFLIGGLIGFFYFRNRFAGMISSGAGVLIGLIAGGLVLVSSQFFREIALIAFGGCWLLVLIMLLSSRFRTFAETVR